MYIAAATIIILLLLIHRIKTLKTRRIYVEFVTSGDVSENAKNKTCDVYA